MSANACPTAHGAPRELRAKSSEPGGPAVSTLEEGK